MANVSWTSDQQKVIDLRNRNILVSAAAGSGKTAVLVERIINMISEGENPVDVDRLLIVTFTNAAASEMRERILSAIEKKLDSMPDNKHLQKQMMLIHSAQITTIHSFCLNVIRNHFNVIDLDPSFRIADEAELTLLRADVIEALLEDKYDEASEDFTTFVECYANGKSDAALEDLILQLYHFSMSYPWPVEWLNEQKEHFNVDSIELLQQTDWMQGLLQYIKTMTTDLLKRNKQAMDIALQVGGPYMYEEALQADNELLSTLLQVHTFKEYSDILDSLKWKALSRAKDENVIPELREQVKSIRDDVKKAITDIKKSYFYQSEEEMLGDIKGVSPVISVLIDLTVEFAKRFAKAKEDKNLVDFNDLEHFALNILVKKEEGNVVPTGIADELSDYYEEILIDEYQDSNFVQETILKSISKERFGQNNVFMVGDVKQSIYKFRLARPELFMEKFNTYSIENSDRQRIDLHKNFRSRAVVLAGINYIFEQIMTKQLGNIEYDAEAALNPGAGFEDTELSISASTEVLLITDEEFEKQEAKRIEEARQKEEGNNTPSIEQSEFVELNKEEEEYTARELEARAIGQRIKELVQPDTGISVWNKDKKCYETAKYSDIVILLRTMSGWAQTFADTLMSMGIPAFSDTQSGYFSTIEIQTILNMLRVIDNPRQDIPLTAVLHSKMFGLTTTELAIIRRSKADCDIYEASVHFIDMYGGEIRRSNNDVVEDTEIQEITEFQEATEMQEPTHTQEDMAAIQSVCLKLSRFFHLLENYRECLAYTSIHELIWKVIKETGYYDYVSAMPAGDRRRANIDMLIERAVAYESTSYHGLFQFVRYIEKLHKYDIDFGEAVTVGEGENTVRIMSIHKSKGLEFPIVFVSGMSKAFNNQDARSKIVLHPDLGIGPDFVDPTLRVKAPTLLKKYIQKQIVLENLGEELRVLYVALTRAKEKLIITGYLPQVEDKIKKWAEGKDQTSRSLLFQKLAQAGNYLDYIMPALVRHKDCISLLQQYGISPGFNLLPDQDRDTEACFEIRTVDVLRTVEVEVARQVVNADKKLKLLKWDADSVYDETIRSEINRQLTYEYPYTNEVKLHAKVTVSELKKLGQMVDDEDTANLDDLKKSYKESDMNIEFNANKSIEDYDFIDETKVSTETNESVETFSKETTNIEMKDATSTDSEETSENTQTYDDSVLPNFMLESVPLQGARRGTVYHKVLECISFEDDEVTLSNVKMQIKSLMSHAILTQEEADVVNPYQILAFYQSNLAKRVRNAERAGKVYKEQQFVFSVKANEIRPDIKSEEPILVQGIIDCFFEEEDQIIIIDYKTDHVPRETGEEILRARYKVQLDYYQRAIEQITGKKVRERILYSFALEKEVRV